MCTLITVPPTLNLGHQSVIIAGVGVHVREVHMGGVHHPDISPQICHQVDHGHRIGLVGSEVIEGAVAKQTRMQLLVQVVLGG